MFKKARGSILLSTKKRVCFVALIVLIAVVFFLSLQKVHATDEKKAAADKNSTSSCQISDEYMVDIVQKLSVHPREIGTPQIEEAKNIIKDELQEIGYAVEEQSFHYMDDLNGNPFEGRNNLDGYLKDVFVTDGTGVEGINLIAEKEKQTGGKTWLICAHYDCTSDSKGANDNGSGVAVITQVAKMLYEQGLPYRVRFLFFSGEEKWFLGSRYYLGQLTEEERADIAGVINVDTVAEKSDLGYWAMVSDVKEVTDSDGYDLKPVENRVSKLFTDNSRISLYAGMNSDHYPFYLAGIPAVSLVQELTEQSSANTPRDTMEVIDPERLTECAEIVLDVTQKLGKK